MKRGGGELGTRWYEEGKKLKKINSFKDFIFLAEYLIQNNYTNPNLLTAEASSAGGLLLGINFF